MSLSSNSWLALRGLFDFLQQQAEQLEKQVMQPKNLQTNAQHVATHTSANPASSTTESHSICGSPVKLIGFFVTTPNPGFFVVPCPLEPAVVVVGESLLGLTVVLLCGLLPGFPVVDVMVVSLFGLL